VWVLVLGFLMFLSAVSSRFSLLNHRGKLGGLGGKGWSDCEKFEDS